MNFIQTLRPGERTFWSSFTAGKGCEEFFLAIRTSAGQDGTIDELGRAYAEALQRQNLSDETVVFSRLFVNDFVNQQKAIESSTLFTRLRHGGVSVIEQKPVFGGRLSLLSYHIRRPANLGAPVKHVADGASGRGRFGNDCIADLENYRLLFTANYANDGVSGSYGQTQGIFKALQETVDRHSMNLLDNTIRTWIFVRDIDNNYDGMVRARREYFTAHGLTDSTRYLASTGIEGSGAGVGDLVTVDSLSIGGLRQGQIIRIEAPSHLSPTILYKVTFERGLRVRFGDRSHLYISGTASINNKGEVVHVGDPVMQTRRTVENLRALLVGHGAGVQDMAYLLVYLRSFHDWDQVQAVLREEIGDAIPLLAFEARVCRPTWLFELEGVAIIPDKNEYPPFS